MELQSEQAIELGHIFQLGTRYTEALSVTFQDESRASHPVIMGCYGIGVSRIAAAAIEQSHDEHGIIWPQALSPFDALLTVLEVSDAASRALADQLYADLIKEGYDILYDDRELAAGAKFNDADLIGVPCRFVVGKRSASAGQVEFSVRRNSQQKNVLQRSDACAHLKKHLDITA